MKKSSQKSGTTNTFEGGMTMEEVAKELGLSRVRVHQIEKQALEKVRIKLQIRNINPRDFYSELFGLKH